MYLGIQDDLDYSFRRTFFCTEEVDAIRDEQVSMWLGQLNRDDFEKVFEEDGSFCLKSRFLEIGSSKLFFAKLQDFFYPKKNRKRMFRVQSSFFNLIMVEFLRIKDSIGLK